MNYKEKPRTVYDEFIEDNWCKQPDWCLPSLTLKRLNTTDYYDCVFGPSSNTDFYEIGYVSMEHSIYKPIPHYFYQWAEQVYTEQSDEGLNYDT